MNPKEIAAQMIQTAICDAVCDNSLKAKKWLLLHRDPSEIETIAPPMYSFIYVCSLLGLNWYNLRESLKGAVGVDSLVVQTTEPCYNQANGPRSTTTKAHPGMGLETLSNY